MINPGTETLHLYVGTYTEGGREGIYLFELSPRTGALNFVRAFEAGENPSYLTLDRQGHYLYAVNETEEFEGEKSGSVSAFAVNDADGGLSFRGRVPSGGAAPCYISIGPGGRSLLVANYKGGSIALLPLKEDGTPETPSDVVRHQGSGANRERQDGPHLHSIVPDAGDRFVLAADLGTDTITVYRLDEPGPRFTRNDRVDVRGGSGPRHIAVHPSGRFVYAVTELDSTVIALSYQPESGLLKELGTISTLPDGFMGESLGAEIRLGGDGRYLYASNRGHDSIAIFSLDQETGEPALVGHVGSGGEEPRGLVLASGVMVVGNQKSDSIGTFMIDPGTGMAVSTGYCAEVPRPVCFVVRGKRKR